MLDRVMNGLSMSDSLIAKSEDLGVQVLIVALEVVNYRPVSVESAGAFSRSRSFWLKGRA